MWPELEGSALDKFMRWLLSQDTHCGSRIYAHNGGNFDALYLVRWLVERQSEFTIELTPVQATVLCLQVIEKRMRRRQRRWMFLDSLRLMNASLDKLGKAFGLGGKLDA